MILLCCVGECEVGFGGGLYFYGFFDVCFVVWVGVCVFLGVVVDVDFVVGVGYVVCGYCFWDYEVVGVRGVGVGVDWVVEDDWGWYDFDDVVVW